MLGAEQQLGECKIFAPNFNIMSGLGANSLAVGQKFARIFEVCNTLVY